MSKESYQYSLSSRCHFLCCCTDLFLAIDIYIYGRSCVYGVAQIREMIYVRFSITPPLYGSIIGDICNLHLSTMEFHYSKFIDNEISVVILAVFYIKYSNFSEKTMNEINLFSEIIF